jgi:hypothetical protein
MDRKSFIGGCLVGFTFAIMPYLLIKPETELISFKQKETLETMGLYTRSGLKKIYVQTDHDSRVYREVDKYLQKIEAGERNKVKNLIKEIH